MKGKAHHISHLGMLLSLALILQLVEAMVPPIGFPGIKLGLANSVIMLTLFLWGWQKALVLTVLRQLVGSLLAGRLFSVGFYLGLGGGLAGIGAMILWLALSRKRGSLVGASLAGAIAHNWGQWLVAGWLINHYGIVWYLPILTIGAIPCGILVAYLANPLLKLMTGLAGTDGIKDYPSLSPITFRPQGIVLLILLIVFSVAVPVYAGLGSDEPGSLAQIKIDGQIVKELDLTQDGEWDNNDFSILVHQGSLRVVHSNCPDQICVLRGPIKREGEAVVCVPNRILITIISQNEITIDGYLP